LKTLDTAARFLALGVATLTVAATPDGTDAQEKYAVFVGINDYIAYEDEPGGDLEGAERDARLMRAVLTERWGVEEENTLTLLSRDATRDAIREAITGWLTDRAEPGDLAIFYFAGHGAQAFDLDGDEPDGLDETLAPSDILRHSSDNDIRDDDFRQWLAGVRTDVVVILDSCHSGTATRGGNMRTRSLDRPLPPEGGKEPERVRQQYDPESMADGSTTIIELAAAAPNQSAMEGEFRSSEGAGTEARGAFTYHLVRELRQASEDTSYEELLSHLMSSMKADQLMQDPQLIGGGTLFGSARSKAAPTLSRRRDTTSSKAVGIVDVEFRPAHLSVDASALPASRRVQLRAELAGHPGIELLEAASKSADLFLLTNQEGSRIEVLGKDGQVRSTASEADETVSLVPNTVRALEQAWAARALAALDNPSRPFGIGITSTRGNSVGGGAGVTVTVTSARPGYLTLAALAPDGHVDVLTPDAADHRLDAGEPVSIELEVPTSTTGSTTGLRFVLAIVTPDPLSVMVSPTAPSEPRDRLLALRQALEQATGVPGSALRWNSRLIVVQPAARRGRRPPASGGS